MEREQLTTQRPQVIKIQNSIVDQSFVELLKEDYAKKSFRARQRRMQDALEKTISTLNDPHTHSREHEKSKLIPSQNCSMVDSFTGDHKFNNFKAKQSGRDR